jgi:hypothetical protein
MLFSASRVCGVCVWAKLKAEKELSLHKKRRNTPPQKQDLTK